MILKNLLHIKKNGIHLIGSLNPLFFYRLSDITSDFIDECSFTSYQDALLIVKSKYGVKKFEEFEKRINKIKDQLFSKNNQFIKKIDNPQRISNLTLNITRRCNLKCSYCFESEEYRRKGDMTIDIAKKAADVFLSNDTEKQSIIFTGGEPLLNYNLIKELVKYTTNQNLKVEFRVKTNATLLNEEKINFLIKNNFKIQISLDGNKIAHDTHRLFPNGKGSFNIVDKKIRRLIALDYAHNTMLSGTTTRQTIDHINDSYGILNSYEGVRYDLKTVMPNSNSDCILGDKDYKTAYLALEKNNSYLKMKSKQIIGNKKNICGIGIWSITIDVDGTIYPCYRMCGDRKYIIGSLDSFDFPFKLPQELEDIYNLDNQEMCSKCFFLDICKKGCYTDKLAGLENTDKCFLPAKKIMIKLLEENLIDKKSYRSLPVI